MSWKFGRGKLGMFEPLLGTWITDAPADTERGPVTCTRNFTKTLNGKYIELRVSWKFADYHYDELCVFGVDADNTVRFWSFTSDGKRSEGVLSDAADVHAKAVCFEADMNGRIARQVYWPSETAGIEWTVESKTKKGWNRFVHHHYLRA